MWRNGIEISGIQTLRMKRPTLSRSEEHKYFIYSLLTSKDNVSSRSEEHTKRYTVCLHFGNIRI